MIFFKPHYSHTLIQYIGVLRTHIWARVKEVYRLVNPLVANMYTLACLKDTLVLKGVLEQIEHVTMLSPIFFATHKVRIL